MRKVNPRHSYRCVTGFRGILVPHGRYPAGLASLGERANIDDAQHAATHAQLVLQNEAILGT